MQFKNKSYLILFLSILLIFSTFFVSCAKPAKNEDAEAYKQKILQLSQKFITYVLENKYDQLFPMMDKKMQKVFTKDQILSFSEGVIAKFGKPHNFKFSGGGRFQAYYMALILVEHEKANLTYQVAFDKNDKISGFYIKKVEDKKSETTTTLPSYVNTENFKEINTNIGNGHIVLDGKITLPEKVKKAPFVILVHGSGANDMDETIGPNKIFKDIAYGLSSNGIGVLRYNKRTYQYPKTGIDPENYTIYDITINDAVEAYKKLLTYKFVDKNNIYILGHSLGGMVAPLIYQKIMQDKKIKYKPKGIIIMAGTVDNLANLILRQTKFQAKIDGKITNEEIQNINDIEKKVEKINNKEYDNNFDLVWKGTFWKSIENYSTLEYLQNSYYPILVLQGLKDIQVFPDIAKSFEKKLINKRNITFSYFDNLNHLMMPVKDKSTGREYLTPNFVDFEVINKIKSFIHDNL